MEVQSPEKSRAVLDELIVRITVHSCDNLKSDVALTQPVVCMHIVDADHGTYIKKSSKERAVMSFYENQRDDVDYIMPVMTQPCSVQKGRFHFSWEESFIINEKFDYLFKRDFNTVLFFEVIDLMSLQGIKSPSERNRSSGMQTIAWAFLKVFGPNEVINTGSKLRLQLHKTYPHQKDHIRASKIEVYNWWSKFPKIPLKASLSITVEPSTVFNTSPALRSMLPLQQEMGTTTSENFSKMCVEQTSGFTEEFKSASLKDQKIRLPWSRKNGQPCKIPRHLKDSLETTGICHILKFSSFGRLLLAACGSLDNYYLLLYEIPSGKLLQKEFAHPEVVYDLDWSHNDNYILSASSDYSVKMWNVKLCCQQTFMHPSFVYSAKFLPTSENVFATGCYDHIIRIWRFYKSLELVQELEGHNSSISAIIWHASGNKLFSADNVGQIKVWKWQGNDEKYLLEQEINLQTKDISVGKIHPNSDNKLLLFCNDSVKLLDLHRENVVFCFESVVPSRTVKKGCCSPCGDLIFICQEERGISVWSMIMSQKITTLPASLILGRPSSVDYHPFNHMLAVGSWEEDMPIHIYVSEPDDGDDIQKLENVTTYESKRISNLTTYPTEKCVPEKNAHDSRIPMHLQNPVSKPRYKKLCEKYMHDVQQCTDENPETLSSISKSQENIFDTSVSSHDMRKKSEEFKPRSEQLTTVITKSDQFDDIALSCGTKQSNESSKRSQRRKRLKDMNKTTLQ